jgi:hypothetical protein
LLARRPATSFNPPVTRPYNRYLARPQFSKSSNRPRFVAYSVIDVPHSEEVFPLQRAPTLLPRRPGPNRILWC